MSYSSPDGGVIPALGKTFLLGVFLVGFSIHTVRDELRDEERELIVTCYSKMLWSNVNVAELSDEARRRTIESIFLHQYDAKSFNELSLLDFDEALRLFQEHVSTGLRQTS